MSQKDECGAMKDGQGKAPIANTNPEPVAELGTEIAKQLRALYGRQMAEPLPDKFTTLLEQLAKAERKEGGA